MITLFTKNNSIRVDFKFTDSFSDIIDYLKLKKCKFDPVEKNWIVPPQRYESIVEGLMDYDTIESSYFSEKELTKILEPEPELKKSPVRVLFDQSVLKFPPVVGKEPNVHYQKVDIQRAISRNRYAMFLDMGLGKEQTLDTKIQSPQGPIRMGDIRVGDEIFNSYGATSKVLQIHPQGMKDVIKIITSDGSTTECGYDHLWTVCDAQNKYKEVTLKTSEIMEGIKAQRGRKGISGNYSRYRLPQISPVDFPKKNLPLPPYFIGALIGDGHLAEAVVLTIHPSDKEILERCQSDLLSYGFDHKVSPQGDFGHSFINVDPRGRLENKIKTSLRGLDLLHKHSYSKIPEVYLRSNVQDRLDLLRGLMDTGGYIDKKGSVIQIGFSNKILILQTKELIESLGGRSTSVKEFIPVNTSIGNPGELHYNMTFKLPKDINPFYLNRKASRMNPNARDSFRYIKDYEIIPEKKECQCITVDAPNHLYLTDSYIPTHNSYYKAAIIAHLRAAGKAKKVLIISSNIGAANLAHEMRKFAYIDPEEIICMTKAGKDRDLFKKGKTIAITNYNTFKYICDYYYQLKNGKKPDTKKYRAAVIPFAEWFEGEEGILLLDESHHISNPKSQMTQRVLSHVDAFEYRYLFSGTPADKPEKLYSQLRVLDSALVHNYTYQQWLEEYAIVGTNFSPYAIAGWQHDKLKGLNERIVKDYAIFRKTEDCLELPENHMRRIHVDLEPEHKAIYEAFVVDTLSELGQKKGSMLTRDIMNTFPYLQMALDNPEMLKLHADKLNPQLLNMVDKFKWKHHKKLEVLLDICLDHVKERNEKGIIWIYHPDTAKRLAKELEDFNPLVIIGETENREEIIAKFKKDPKHKILIASIPILNTSVTLIESKWQVYFERVYAYNQFKQSIKRISRIGQDKETNTYILIFSRTIDVMLDLNLETKDVINNKILSKDFLSKDEWRRIFTFDGDTNSLGF